jgi:hypothetical protein
VSAVRRAGGGILGAVAAAVAAGLALVSPLAARAAPPGTAAVLELANGYRLADPAGGDGRHAALPPSALKLPDDDGEDPPGAAWLHRRVSRWDTYDGVGYRLRSRARWFVGGELERRSGPEPLAIEPDEEPDSPRRRIVGADAYSVGVVLDLSELRRLLVALGAGGGHPHLHAYLGWRLGGAGEAPGG